MDLPLELRRLGNRVRDRPEFADVLVQRLSLRSGSSVSTISS